MSGLPSSQTSGQIRATTAACLLCATPSLVSRDESPMPQAVLLHSLSLSLTRSPVEKNERKGEREEREVRGRETQEEDH